MKSVAFAAFLVGAAVAILLVLHAGIPVLLNAIEALGLSGLAIVTGARLPVIALLGVAWWVIGGGKERPRLARFIWARAVRDAAAEALPFSQLGGYVIGARALVLAGATGAWAGVSTLLDLILELSAKVPYVLAGLALLAWLKPPLAALSTVIAAVICAAASLAVLQVRPAAWPARAAARAFSRWPQLADMRARTMAAIQEIGARPAALRDGVAVHALCWFLGAAETWLMFWLMHRTVAPGPALIIDSLVGALRAASFFVPGALGVQEGGYVLLCGLFGIAPAAALAVSLARRARDLLLALVVLPTWQWAEGRALPSRFKS